ncbi:unnamed protein product [Adineta ricciae]|uniref:Uncharacterized protein n=1 Tax=Adineta ricciae TaxID=249248 RepID=A0A814Z335_ADIRI|nr:unnamed protein product [Adineta ricciae]
MKHLAFALSVNQTLIELDLSYIQIHEQGMRYLSDGLRRNRLSFYNVNSIQTLIELVLSYNRLGDALRENKTLTILLMRKWKNLGLTSLALPECEINDRGVHHIANALRKNRTLTYICLMENQIGDQSAHHLADALHRNQTLTELFFSKNRVGNEGSQYLAKAIRKALTLQKLFLSGNRISDQRVQHFVDVVQSRQITLIFTFTFSIVDSDTNQSISEHIHIVMDKSISLVKRNCVSFII